jgi:hypothetical protein
VHARQELYHSAGHFQMTIKNEKDMIFTFHNVQGLFNCSERMSKSQIVTETTLPHQSNTHSY